MTTPKFLNSEANLFTRLTCRAILIAGLVASTLTFIPRPLHAQSDTGRVGGSVLDSTGAILPGASVKLTNVDTGATQTVTSGSDGNFSFAAVMRGNYKIEVAQSGFATTTQTFSLQVSQVEDLSFRLTPGGSTTTVDVTASEPIVDTSTSSTGAVIEGKQVSDLPLNGRNFTQLALLTPGVTRGGFSSDASGRNGNVENFRYSESGGAAISANGLRQQSNNFLIDGVDNNESLVNSIVFFSPPEAIDQFRVTTSVAPAEFGRAGGAIINSSIKSGTDNIHGTAFGYFRDQVFDANPNYFATPQPVPRLHRKQFWISAGGAIHKERRLQIGENHSKSPEGQAVPLWRLPGLSSEAAAERRLPYGADGIDAPRQLQRIAWPERHHNSELLQFRYRLHWLRGSSGSYLRPHHLPAIFRKYHSIRPDQQGGAELPERLSAAHPQRTGEQLLCCAQGDS